MGPILGVILPLGAFAMIVLIVYFAGGRQHVEKMELIRRGINTEKPGIKMPGEYSLPIGILFFAIGLGFFAPAIIIGDWKEYGEIGWSLAFLIAGIGLIIHWKITAPDRMRAMKLKEDLLRREGTVFAPDIKPEE